MKNTNNIITRSLSVFTRDSLLASFLFFLVLSSWYILRPVRNEMAVANVNELGFGAICEHRPLCLNMGLSSKFDRR